MTERYEATYSAGPEPSALIFPEGTFEALPFEVRLAEPWYGCFYVDAKQLKPSKRLEIMRSGYALLTSDAITLQDAA